MLTSEEAIIHFTYCREACYKLRDEALKPRFFKDWESARAYTQAAKQWQTAIDMIIEAVVVRDEYKKEIKGEENGEAAQKES